MNGEQLQAWVNGHKGEAAAGGLVVVIGLVYWTKHRKAAASAGGASSFSVPATAAGTIGAAPYDSSANDVYNSVQGVLEQLQNTANQIATTAPVTQQVPVTPPSAWNPAETPWAALINGVFTDTRTGRGAFYGPQGQPGTASPTGQYTTSYVMPDGRTAYYNPTSWTYADGSVNTPGEQYAQSQRSGAPVVGQLPGQGTTYGLLHPNAVVK